MDIISAHLPATKTVKLIKQKQKKISARLKLHFIYVQHVIIITS